MITVIIGFTGQGKSTLAYCVAQRCQTRVIIDPRGQFHTTPEVIPDAGELYELLDNKHEMIVQPGRGESLSENLDQVSTVLADWIEDNPTERICIILDEGRLLGLDSKIISPNLDWIIRSAREGSPIDLIITCHRPVDVSTNIRAISNRLVFFRVMLPNDLEVIEEQCGPTVAEEVNRLLDKQYLVWNNSRQQWRKVSDPGSWYVSISGGVTSVGHVS